MLFDRVHAVLHREYILTKGYSVDNEFLRLLEGISRVNQQFTIHNITTNDAHPFPFNRLSVG